MLIAYLENEEEYTWDDDEYTHWEVNDPWLIIYKDQRISGLAKAALVKVVIDDKDVSEPIQMKNDEDEHEHEVQKFLNTLKGSAESW